LVKEFVGNATFFLNCFQVVFAQKISGTLTDARRQPQGFATVTLQTVPDSTLVKVLVSASTKTTTSA